MKTNATISIRRALTTDISAILKIFDQARNFQRESGFVQWIDGYPNMEVVEHDIEAENAFVIEYDGITSGYFFIAYNDSGYDSVPDVWDYRGRFAVVHRLAIADSIRGKGLAAAIFTEAERLAHEGGALSMRVDTGSANVRMHRLMNRLGYLNKGELLFSWGPRLSYEKELPY